MLDFMSTKINRYVYSIEILVAQKQKGFDDLQSTFTKDLIFYIFIVNVLMRTLIVIVDEVTSFIRFVL